MQRRALVSLLPVLLACRATAEPAEELGSETSDGGDDAGESGESEGGESEGGEEVGSSGGSGSTDGVGSEATTDEGCDTDEGPLEFCEIGPGDEPWLALHHLGQQLEPGGTLELECGGQGSFMFRVSPELGGFVPESAYLHLHATLAIDGFNIGFGGHFAETELDLYVACCEYDGCGDGANCYYLATELIMFPPDGLPDMISLHGQQGQLTVVADIPAGELETTLDLTIWAVSEDAWDDCYALEPGEALASKLPIPG